MYSLLLTFLVLYGYLCSIRLEDKVFPLNNCSNVRKYTVWRYLVFSSLHLHIQCCSCLFVSGRTVVYRCHYKRPQFPPKVEVGGPTYRLQRLMLPLMLTSPAGLCWQLDWPGRTLSRCGAWQLQHCSYLPLYNMLVYLNVNVNCYTIYYTYIQ